jgi:alkylation response protein AidB-like acyl-CoA dehydrogenase
MEPVLNEHQTLLRDGAVKLCRETGGPKRARQLRDAGTEMDTQAWKHFADGGWLGTAVPEEAGGLGMGMFEVSLVLEEAGRQLLALPLTETTAASWALARSDERKRLPAVLAGSTVVVPAFASEGWQAGGAAQAKFESGAVSGKVRFVAYGPSADAYLVAASDPKGEPVLALVHKSKGVSISTVVNVDGSTSSDVAFEKAPADAIARGPKAAELERRTRELLALGAAAQLLGASSAALDMTLEYIKVRQQFGKPLGSFQALQHRAADCFVDLELNRSLIYRVYSAWDAGQHHPAMVSAAKARASRSAMETTRAALQLHGAIGYTDEHDIGLYYKRAVALAALYGNEIHHTGRFSRLTVADA